MKRVLCALFLAAVMLAPAIAATAALESNPTAADLYVAPNGSDSNPGTRTRPLATLAGARDAVRRQIAAGLKADVRVLFRGGAYPLNAPVVFGPEDSGSEQCSITYAASPGETPVFSGGRRITGWQKVSSRLWKAEIPAAKGGQWIFRRLYVNGERRTLARTPNAGNYYRIKASDSYQEAKTSFEFNPGDIKNWPKLHEINAVVLVNWENGLLPLASVNEQENLVTFTGGMAGPQIHFKANDRYFLENFREALDAPGEWYLDRAAGTLYYYPRPGEDMKTVSVVAPVLTQFLRVEGDANASRFVRGLRFEGLRFRHADYQLEPAGHSDPQAAQRLTGAITLTGARDCALEKCEIANVGIYGIEVGAGCSGNRIVRNEIHDLGAGAVMVRRDSDHTTIHNNFLHDGGSVYFGAVAVIVQASSDNVITHNEICDFNYTGISVGWSWGFHPTPCARNQIEYNHIHHVGRGVLTDLAGIYTLGLSPGTTIRYNLIHHVWDWPEGYLGSGIYPDEGSSGLLIENNVVYATSHGGLHVHYGRDNIVRNNIFAFGRDAQIQMGRNCSNDVNDKRKWLGYTESSMTFERNIVLFDRGDLYRRQSQIQGDNNLYYNTAGAPFSFPGGVSLAEWRAKGHDSHSRIADPRFMNAKQFDFRLRKDSPARALGFQPIDISGAGLVGEPGWVNLPKQIRRPETGVPARVVASEITGLDEGFETTRPGSRPRLAHVYGENGEAAIRVTDEVAASGKRCLKFLDAAGLSNGYDPHMYYRPEVTEGVVRASFDLRREEGATGYMEWRDWSGDPFIVGPSLSFRPDGSLEANKKPLMTLPHGQWIHFEIACPLGKQAKGTYDLTVTVPGGQPQVFRKLACDPRFVKLTWVGFSSLATDKRVFYLDNLKLNWK